MIRMVQLLVKRKENNGQGCKDALHVEVNPAGQHGTASLEQDQCMVTEEVLTGNRYRRRQGIGDGIACCR